MTLRTKNLISGTVIALLFAGVFVVAWKVVFFPAKGSYVVKAEFRDAGGITKNSDVKIGGVPGGQVDKILLNKDDTATVVMRLDKNAAPIGAGAFAASRPVNLLGEKYIDLRAGDLSKPAPSGVVIPLSRTSRPVELDDLLNVLQPGIRARLRIFINEAGIAMDGAGADFNKALEDLPPALDQTQQVVKDFGADNAALKDVITRSDRVIGSFNRENKGLQDLVDSAEGTLKITADKRVALASTIRQAPATLRQLQKTLGELGATSRTLEPLAVQTRAAAPQLASTLNALPAFADSAKPALKAAKQVAPTLTRLGQEASTPVHDLNPTLGNLATFSQKLQPVLDTADQQGGFKGILDVMNGWASDISRVDGLGHTFGTQLTVDDTVIAHALTKYGLPMPGTKRSTKLTDAVPRIAGPSGGKPKLTLPRIKLPALPKIKLPNLPDLPVPAPVKKALDQIGQTTGKLLGSNHSRRSQSSSSGETSKLLDYLLGP
jgi:phospholipid/cholesterol/gamma-HCH transport system substrate-binding protein